MKNEFVDGFILGIKVQNFFCHDNVEVKFKKSITFIVGENGSGKSAILTALVVGLGGRANDTNRGNKVNSFIKTGADSATIEIKIKNSGPKAFKHNEYGDELTIIRIIPKMGNGIYKVRSMSGKDIKVTHKHIEEILLAFNIQIDNPISVLNQDDIKNFINFDKEKMFDCLSRATNIAQSEKEYIIALNKTYESKGIWEDKKKECKKLNEQCKDWEHQSKQWDDHEGLKTRKEDLKRELQWSKIEEVQSEVSSLQNEYELKRKECDEQEIELQHTPDKSAIQNLKEQLKIKREEKDTVEKEKKTLEKECYKVEAECQSLQFSITKNLDLIEKEKQKVAKFEREIEEITSGAAERLRSKLEQSWAATEALVQEMQAQLTTALDFESNTKVEHDQAVEASHNAQRLVGNKETQLESLQKQKRELQNDSPSRAQYSKLALELRKRVWDDAGEFTLPPKGPIGEFLQITDEKWSSPLEHIIGSKIYNYCVNDSTDVPKLLGIIEEVYSGSEEPKPAVVCSEFLSSRHDVSRRAVSNSALDALRVSDDVVANFLIDELSLETIMLMEDEEKAADLASRAPNVPANCRRIVTLDCSDYYPAPHFRCHGGQARPACILRVSAEYALTQLDENICKITAELNSAREKLSICESKAKEAKEKMIKAVEEKTSKSHRLRGAQIKHLEVQKKLHSCNQPQNNDRIEELNTSKQNIVDMEKEINEFEEKKEACFLILKGINVQVENKKSNFKDITNVIEYLCENLEQEKSNYEQSVRDHELKAESYNTNTEKLRKLKKKIDKKLSKEHSMRASSREGNFDNPRSVQEVTAALEEIDAQLYGYEQLDHTKDEVRAKLKTKRDDYKTANDTLNDLDILINKLNKDVNNHINICKLRQTLITRRAQTRFTRILKFSGIQGHLVVRHGLGTLSFSEAGTASGGEGTNSVAALLIALWEILDLPFSFVDEIDVFLDTQRRDKLVQLMLHFARKYPTRQFLFVTPNPTNHVIEAHDLDIIQM